MNMQKGGYYILLNDITLPCNDDEDSGVKAFVPNSATFASFDGNGHSINFAGTYDMGSLSEFGLFTTLSENSIIKNLIVNYVKATDGSDLNQVINGDIYDIGNLRTVKFVTTADTFTFGSIVAENEGIITNCQVISERSENNTADNIYLTIKADNALSGSSYMGGLVGRNSGYITNCDTSLLIKAPFNIAGLVAQNYSKISASSFKEGKIINNSQYRQYVAGLVLTNADQGQIITSFVSGAQSNTSLYAQDENSYITASIAGAGFVYENDGTIKDCYTDIDLSKTTSEMAGFVEYNYGTIKNCFSLSILRNYTTASSGFARESNGTFANCYYLYNNDDDGSDKINSSLNNVTFDGVSALTKDGFANLDNFEGYSYEDSISTNAVWFFSQGHTSSDFVKFEATTQRITITNNDNKNVEHSQTNTIFESKLMTFGCNRLELVSPNVKVLSVRNFSYSEMDEETGDITYFYEDDSNSQVKGSTHNPRLIYSSTTMENEILNSTSRTNLNTQNYRLLCDVSYDSFEGHSGIYKVTYAGVMEGNGMEITSISLVSLDKNTNGGLFGQIGYSLMKTGSVKNLSIYPSEVAFSNTSSVGVLAGTLKYGFAYDITVAGMSGQDVTVSGLNFVGGIVGKAINYYKMKDLYSEIDVSATYLQNDDASPYSENSGSETDKSYAGAIAGYVGNGTVFNSHVNNISSVVGSRVGFAFGGIGRDASVKYTYVDVLKGSKMKPYHYAGYVAGEVSGNLQYSYVSNNGNTESSFSNVPRVASAIGGIAGRLNGGTISDALMSQEFVVNATESNSATESVGGIVGVVNASDYATSIIKNVVVTCDLSATITLGGGVGTIKSATEIDQVAIKSSLLSLSGQTTDPCLGGIVGEVDNSTHSSLSMKNSYCTANLSIKTRSSGIQSTAQVGGLIGFASKTPKLAYCYTTSFIDAEVYDSRQTGSTQPYSEEMSTYADFNYNEKDSNYDNVYYFGGSTNSNDGAVSDYSVYSVNTSFVSFKTKVKTTKIGLNINNFGKSSMTYTNDYFKVSNSNQVSALYNLFGINYQNGTTKLVYSASEDTFGNLVYSSSQNKYVRGSLTYVKKSGSAQTYKSTNGDSFELSELTHNELYTDGTNYYVNESVNGIIKYKDISTGNYVQANNLSLVWNLSANNFSSLYMENSFIWLNKI
jgi:hypothetical protein